jgi:beta-glucosidase-like glycosyl hydrolase
VQKYHDQFRRNKWYPVHASKHLITDILKNELGFSGVVVTDWKDIITSTQDIK